MPEGYVMCKTKPVFYGTDKGPSNERGSVLIVALLILIFLTLLGIASTTTTEIEIQLAGNERFHKVAFYNTDSGVYTSPEIIYRSLEDGAQPSLAGRPVEYLEAGADTFFREMMGYDAYDTQKDLRLTIGDETADIDVKRVRQAQVVGGGAEFGSAGEGVGSGSAGGVAIIYSIDSLGTGPSSSQASIVGEYRYVPGVAR